MTPNGRNSVVGSDRTVSDMQWTTALLVFVAGFLLVNGLDVEDSRAQRADAVMSTTLSTVSTILGAIGFIKLKIMLFLMAAFFVVGLLSKLLGGIGALTCGGLGIACPPGQGVNGYSTGYITYSQPDYTFSDSFRAYSHPSFIESISRSIDFMDVSFKMYGIEDENCKKKFICMAENEALENPFLDFAIKVFGNNLMRHQNIKSTKQKKDCDLIYRECESIKMTSSNEKRENPIMLPNDIEKKTTSIVLKTKNMSVAKA